MKELLDMMEEIIVEEFWKIDPFKLLVISLHLMNVCKEVIRLEGGKMRKEPHAGARRAANLMVENARGDVSSSSDEESSDED